MQKLLALFILSFLPCFSFSQQSCDCDSALRFVYHQWARVQNMSYHSVSYERHLDSYNEAEFDFVVQHSPYKVAGVMTKKRHRLLYDPAHDQTNALYISSGFPYMNVWLDINGGVFRGLNHYTISNAGCEFIFGIIRSEYDKMPEKFRCRQLEENGASLIEITATTKDFHFKDYKAKAGETVLDIAMKFNVMAYQIIEYNDGIDSYLDDCGGKTVKIASHYGSNVKLVVDANHGMPTFIEVSDERGLLERYIYTNYIFNRNLPANYFTEDYLDNL